jgi:hypothetical protein
MTAWELLDKHKALERIISRRHVTDSGCWEWVGSRRAGYGRINIDGKSYSVHRLMAFLLNEEDYDDRSRLACHRCDNPPCFNPEHLFIGTAEDNMRDMLAKGRRGPMVRRRPSLHPRSRPCDVCGGQYAPDPKHRGRSRVCSPECHVELRRELRAGQGFKLTPDDVRAIRDAYRAGESLTSIGRRFSVSKTTIHDIKSGRRWGTVK